MSMVRLFSLADLRSFPLDSWGIPSPPPLYSSLPRPSLFGAPASAAEPSLLDVIFLPGLAFDEVGGRLGHGKGYYDRFVARCDQIATQAGRPRPLLVGLCLNEQLLAPGKRVPMGDLDRFVDYVVTEKKVIERVQLS